MVDPPTLISSLDTRPDYASALGVVCSEWANLEWHMFHLYASVCGSPPALARATFGAIESNRGRREIILANCQTAVQDACKVEEIDKLLGKLGKLAGRRNKAVHNLWLVADTPQREVMQMRLSEVDGTQCVEGIALNDIRALAQDIRDMAHKLNSLREELSDSLASSIEKLRQQPGIGLVFAAKGHPPGRKPKGFHAQQPPSQE